MSTAMYLDICHAVSAKNKYFQRKVNAAGLPGFATVQKVTAALRMLAYGGPADRLDDYIRMGVWPVGLSILGGSVASAFAVAGSVDGSPLLADMEASHSFHFISLRNMYQQ